MGNYGITHPLLRAVLNFFLKFSEALVEIPQQLGLQFWLGEAVLNRVLYQLLELGIGQSIGLRGAQILVGGIGPRDTFIVGCDYYRHSILQVNGKGMPVSADTQNLVVAGKADLHRNV